jgi:hypothetical protein
MNSEKQVQATREGGRVQRCHVVDHKGLYDVAQHTFGALNLLLLLHPQPSLQLIKAVQWHDVAERWTGDVPATAKWMSPRLREALQTLEVPLMKRFGLHVDITREEQDWLAAVDILELWLWAREHQEESHPKQLMGSCVRAITSLHVQNSFPREAWDFYVRVFPTQQSVLPDMFDGIVEAGQ